MSQLFPAIKVTNAGKCFHKTSIARGTFREKLYELTRFKKAEKATAPFWALRHISFEIMPGEIVGIIGANGAGKSTLLKLMAEITEPTEGSLAFRGKVVSVLEIGTGFHPDLTGIENIYLSGSLLHMTRIQIESKMQSIADFSELGDFLQKQVKYYSSGMFLRLAFAVCTHLDADILLLDEIVSVGDAAFAIKSLARIREIAREGKTIVLASHDLNSVQHICNKCILLDKGSLLDIGETSQLVERYIEQGVLKSLQQMQACEKFITTRHFNKPESNSAIALSSICVYNQNESAENFSMNDALTVECSFEKMQEGEAALSFIVNYNLQSAVLSAAQLNSSSQAHGFFSKGSYSATCNFPGSFFNHGIFSIDVYFTDPESNVVLREENALIFKIEHSRINLGNLKYEGKYNGPLYPKLNWQLHKK